MRNLWIRFGCFLIGYNYNIVRNSSEIAVKSVIKYTSAILIICILWAFVGFSFTERYLKGSFYGSLIGATISVFIIIQIERQIILSTNNQGLYIFRACLAILMALIGAVIIDQIILKQDIELERISYIGNKVDELLPSKSAEIKNQVLGLDSTIRAKEKEREDFIVDVSKNPMIKSFSSQTQSIPVTVNQVDSLGNQKTSIIMKSSTVTSSNNTANPKQALIESLDKSISEMRKQKIVKDSTLLNIRPNLENEIMSKTGFLDELKIMYILISNSAVAFCFWLLWALFLLFIEILVLISKKGDKENDYDKTILHQMNLQIKKLDVLSKFSQGN